MFDLLTINPDTMPLHDVLPTSVVIETAEVAKKTSLQRVLGKLTKPFAASQETGVADLHTPAFDAEIDLQEIARAREVAVLAQELFDSNRHKTNNRGQE